MAQENARRPILSKSIQEWEHFGNGFPYKDTYKRGFRMVKQICDPMLLSGQCSIDGWEIVRDREPKQTERVRKKTTKK